MAPQARKSIKDTKINFKNRLIEKIHVTLIGSYRQLLPLELGMMST
jgi:hypothetical protein